MEIAAISHETKQISDAAEKLSDRQWYERLQSRLAEASMPAAPHPVVVAYAAPAQAQASYMLYTHAGTTATMHGHQGSANPAPSQAEKDKADSVQAVDSSGEERHVDARL